MYVYPWRCKFSISKSTNLRITTATQYTRKIARSSYNCNALASKRANKKVTAGIER